MPDVTKRKRWTQLGLPGADGVANDGGPLAPANETSGLDDVLGGARPAARCPEAGAEVYRARELGGRRAKRRGEALEREVRAYLGSAEVGRVVAHWMQVWPEARHRSAPDGRGGWRWELRWGERAHADFSGTTADGRSFAIECKTVEGPRLPRTRVEAHQAKHLDAVARAGGVALLALEFRDEGPAASIGRLYVVPWALVPWAKARSAESVDEPSVARFRVRHGGQFFDRLRGAA